MNLDELLDIGFSEVAISDTSTERMRKRLKSELIQVQQATPEIMTLEETAEYLRVTPDLVYELMGDLPCFELGGRILFRKEALEEWILKRERQFSRQLDNDVTSEPDLKLCL